MSLHLHPLTAWLTRMVSVALAGVALAGVTRMASVALAGVALASPSVPMPSVPMPSVPLSANARLLLLCAADKATAPITRYPTPGRLLQSRSHGLPAIRCRPCASRAVFWGHACSESRPALLLPF